MSSKKYIFCDLDGTLLNDEKKITQKTIDLIKKIKLEFNIVFGIATGRAPTSVLPLLKQEGLEEMVDVVIANNGVDLCLLKEDRFYQLSMVSPSSIKEILSYYKDFSFINVSFHNPNCLCPSKLTEETKRIKDLNFFKFEKVVDETSDFKQTARVMLLFDKTDHSKVQNIISRSYFSGLRGCFSQGNIYEYMDERTSKHKAIETFVTGRGDTVGEVITFGDSDNDIEILANCGLGVAMKNATINAYSVADDQTQFTNNEDGVYEYLHEMFIGGA